MDQPVEDMGTAPTNRRATAIDAAVETLRGTVAEDYIVDAATDEVMRLHLEQFEGPFEVLLYLIRAQEIDIFDIPIVRITEQYLRFIDLLQEENLEVTGDFLVMAATLIQIKSRMVLPADVEVDDEEAAQEDPRLELVEKLIEYRKYRDIVEKLAWLEQQRQEWFTRNVKPKIEADPNEDDVLEVSLYDLIQAFKGVLRYFRPETSHEVQTEGASVSEKIDLIEQHMAEHGSISWTELFAGCRHRVEAVCCFLAILEMCQMKRIRVQQPRHFEEIRIFPRDPGDVVASLAAQEA